MLNLINHLPPNSYFNEAMSNDREVMVAMNRIQEKRKAQGLEDDRPVGPRMSQVSEEARRLGEIVAAVRYLTRVTLVASSKTKATNPGKFEPYPAPVMIDPKTGDWIGKPNQATLSKNHRKRVDLAKQAAERWKKIHGAE